MTKIKDATECGAGLMNANEKALEPRMPKLARLEEQLRNIGMMLQEVDNNLASLNFKVFSGEMKPHPVAESTDPNSKMDELIMLADECGSYADLINRVVVSISKECGI